MSQHHPQSEVVVYVGIAVHDQAFRGLSHRDREYIRSLKDVRDTGVQPILRHGEVVGYGIPVIIADAHPEFAEIEFAKLYERIERARNYFARLMQRTAVPFGAKLYAPKIDHAAHAAA